MGRPRQKGGGGGNSGGGGGGGGWSSAGGDGAGWSSGGGGGAAKSTRSDHDANWRTEDAWEESARGHGGEYWAADNGGSGNAGGGRKRSGKGGASKSASQHSSGGGGRGAETCHKCGQLGHFAKDCRPAGGGDGGGGGCGGGGGARPGDKCHKCGELGHFLRDCPNAAGATAKSGGSGGGRAGDTCRACGELGHYARDCPSGKDRGDAPGTMVRKHIAEPPVDRPPPSPVLRRDRPETPPFAQDGDRRDRPGTPQAAQDDDRSSSSSSGAEDDELEETSLASAGPTQSSQDVRHQGGASGTPAFASQDVRYQADFNPQDVRQRQKEAREQRTRGGQQQQQEGKSKRSRGGRNRGGGARGGGGGEGFADAGDEKNAPEKKNGGRTRGGAAKVSEFNEALSSKIRKCCATYEEFLNLNDLVDAFDALETAAVVGEANCDPTVILLLLLNLTKVSQLSKAHKVIDIMGAHKVYLDVASIVHIACVVPQRHPSHKGLRFLRRLIYECLPEDFGDDLHGFFDRHASFIFSELMAEADGCFGRMENRDSSTLVNLGHTELDMEMDWTTSTSSSFLMFNRLDEKDKKCYIPTIFGGGFQRTDSALMSFDISRPNVASELPRDYDRIRDGAEVEIINSSTGPNVQMPLSVRLTSPPKAVLSDRDGCGNDMKVQFKPGMVYRMDRLASRDQTRRMMEALKTVLQKPGDGNSLQPHESLRELILIPKDNTLTMVGKTHLPLIPMDYSHDKNKMAGLEQFHESKDRYEHLLNKSQMEALNLACTQRITLIQGPPGTGKTTTAVQIVSALVRNGLVDLPLLVTADSNTAVDNLVKGIAKDGLQVVRVGRPESIREDVKQYSLDGRWRELKKAEVICATCIGVSGNTLEKVRFGTVLIDECTQAAESASLVPIARGCQQVVLIGDQCQLPPTVLSDVAETENLGVSLFTRLVTQGVRPVLLDTQYRMHPLICEFASAAFYNGRLQNGVSHLARRPPEGFPWPQRQMPVAFVNLERSEEKREGSSYINPTEAEKALWALQEVVKNDGLKPEDVGMVTPYKGQVNYIKKLIRERPGLARFRTGLEVESVDGFQGQEKEVIIFCAVRNNREGKVGFLADWRRLNVMLTRARRGCIVIGSRSTLVSDCLWKEWLSWATARGAICGEGAKGTWVPRYLVDDRDGMWTVKADITNTAPVSMVMSTSALLGAKDDKAEEVVDSWEDLGSPSNSPKGSPTQSAKVDQLELQGGLLEALDADEEGGMKIDTYVPEVEREREEGGLRTPPTRSPRLRPVNADDEDELRVTGHASPPLGPTSPSRAIAMAKMGLLDDLDLDELPRSRASPSSSCAKRVTSPTRADERRD